MITDVTTFADEVILSAWIQEAAHREGNICGIVITAKQQEGGRATTTIHLSETQMRTLCAAHKIPITDHRRTDDDQ